jgi:hypothetical protein
MLGRFHVKSVVWTRLCAGFAANAAPAVEIDDSIFTSKQRRHGTDLDTRSVSAMVTTHYRKQPARVGKRALFDVLYPSPVNTDRHFMLGLAGNSAGVAADALSVVDYEAKIHSWITGLFSG